MLRATLRGVWANRSRLLMTGLAVVLAVTFMAATLMLTGGIGSGSATATSRANANVGAVIRSTRPIAADGGPGGGATIGSRPALPPAALSVVEAQPGVHAAGVRVSYAQLSRAGGRVIGQQRAETNIGTNWITDANLNPFHIVAGRPPTADGEVVIDRATARHDHVLVGDQLQVVTLAGKQPVTIVGLAGYGDADGITLQSTTLFTESAAQRLLGDGGDAYALVRADGVASSTLAAQLETATKATPNIEVISGPAYVKELTTQLNSALQFIRLFLTAFALIALIVGGSLIYNTFGVAVAQRTRELALLRALGATGRQVFASVVGEAAVVGVVASGVGLGVGFAAEVLLRSVLRLVGFPLLSGGLAATPTSLGVPFALGVLVTVAASLVPARRASRVEPVAALQENSTDASATSSRRRWTGLGLLTVGAVATGIGGIQHNGLLAAGGALAALVGVFTIGPAIVGVISRLAGPLLRRVGGRAAALSARNTSRDARRSAATSNALMLGVAVVVLFSVVAASINRSTAGTTASGVRADTVVSSITTEIGLLRPDLQTDLAKVAGVQTTSAVHVASAAVDGTQAKIGSFDESTIGAVWNFGAVRGDPDALIHGQAFVQTGRAPAVHLGDSLRLTMPDGAVVSITVGGLFTNGFPGFDAPVYVVPSTVFAAHEQVHSSMWILVKRTADATPAAVDSGISTLMNGEVSAKVQTASAWATAGNTQITTLRNLVWALDGMALIIALLGIANSVSLSMHQRKRELGLLRSLGITRTQLSAMVNTEAVLMSVQGAIVGALVGIGAAWGLIRALNRPESSLFSIPVATLGWTTFGAVAAGAIVSLMPSWRAGRAAPLQAIAAG